MSNETNTVNEIYTAFASILAYQIENAYKEGHGNETYLKGLVFDYKYNKNLDQTTKRLPSNLEYVDSFYDPGLSTSGVALRDTNTDDIFIGFTGSNGTFILDKDWWLADGVGIGLGSGVHLPPAYNFYEEIYDKYGERIILTGHSLGGNVA